MFFRKFRKARRALRSKNQIRRGAGFFGERATTFETCEPRLLLTVSPLTWPASASQSLVVKLDGADIKIVDSSNNSVVASKAYADTEIIEITGTSNNSVTIDMSGGNPLPSKSVSFHGFDFYGGSGTNTLLLDDHTSTTATFYRVSSASSFIGEDNDFGIGFYSLSSYTVLGGTQGDKFVIQATGCETTVDGGSGNDDYFVDSVGDTWEGNLNFVNYPLHIENSGYGSLDYVGLSDGADSTSGHNSDVEISDTSAGAITSMQVTGLAGASDQATIDIKASGGGTFYMVAITGSDTLDDTFNITGSSFPMDIDLKHGNDVYNVTGLGSAVDLRGNNDNDTFNILATGSGATCTLTNGYGSDDIVIGDSTTASTVLGAVQISNGLGTWDSLTLNGGATATVPSTGSLTVNSLSVGNGGGGVNVTSGKTLTVNDDFAIAAAKTLAKTGVGTLTIDGTQSHGAGAELDINAGTLNFNTDADGNLDLVADGSSTVVNFNAIEHLNSLAILDGAMAILTPSAGSYPVPPPYVVGDKFLMTNGLFIDVANDSLLNVGNGTVIVDYTGGSNPMSDITDWLVAGYNGYTWDGSGGIISSLAASEVATNTTAPTTSVGVIDNDYFGVVNGLSWTAVDDTGHLSYDTPPDSAHAVPADSVIIKFTYYGDANLSGLADFDDAILVITNLNQPGTWTWLDGDFDYNGTVDPDDVNLFLNGSDASTTYAISF